MNGKEGRGDTSAWTDSPLDRAQKAQQKYDYAFVLFVYDQSISFFVPACMTGVLALGITWHHLQA
jgi:hypothetical protein